MANQLKQWEQQNKSTLQPPEIAWPTVGLLCLGVILFLGSCALTLQGILPVLAGIAINAIAQFMLFTVGHDAAHRSLSQNGRLNDRLGAIALFILSPFASIRTFRFIHAQHHRFTNHDRNADPDAWCGGGSRFTLPLRWISLDIHYLFWYAKKWQPRPKKEKQEFLFTLLLSFSILTIASFLGYGLWLILLWLLPSRLAALWLALAFDYLPHHPFDTTNSEDPYRATNIRPTLSWMMTVILLGQNYHLIHHLYPRLPFYRYRDVWKKIRDPLLASNIRRYRWNGKLL